MVLKISSMVFKVKRHKHELVKPSNPTPNELKLLSNIDDQLGFRYHVPLIFLYRYNPSMLGKDPVQVIREALSKTLVFYYPFAGRLMECSNGKLMVNCNGEGVMFIEADADVTLDDFDNNFVPPFPCFDELLYNVPGSDGIIDSPLLLIQVTRLKCGGFIFSLRMNHTMSDGSGISQFLKALSELANEAKEPSILPMWCRELLCAREPPKVTCIHREYQQLPPDTKSNFIHHSFFFGPKEIAAIRALLPHHLSKSTSFKILTACLWRCRTKALQWKNSNEEIRLLCIVNARCRLNPPLPEGFYGNTVVFPAAVTTVGKLCGRPLGYAVELVKNAKNEATEEYVHSMIDLMETNGRPCFTRSGSFVVSNISKASLKDLDFGWGKALYGGVAKAGLGDIPGVSVYMHFTNSKGEQGRVVPICLPINAMERLEKELDNILKANNNGKMILRSNF
ncbi:13-hydroxylupanine O-tigloyltransferase-like [Cicer arietinum]|uniref:13-hydroxylupanine O-tigloyltransferase-like n=1 Tax=Cicer arietinum TaxID=3827 RepID=A0A1S2YL58_CICAR|nr:13-hydroxylupanine O-tigloyltransferase-like [Cicer arietinum]